MQEMKQSGSWDEAVMAGLPHLLFALLTQSPYLAYRLTSAHVGGDIPLLLFSGLIAVGLFLAWRRRWPRWAAGWIGYGLIMVQIVPLGWNAGYTLMGWLSSQMPIGLANLFFASVVLTLWIGLLIAGRDRPSGLLVALPAVPMLWSWIALDAAQSAVKAPLFLATGLITALAATVIVRLGDVRIGLMIALVTTLLVIPPVTYAHFYHNTYLPRPPFSAVIASLGFRLLVSSILVTGPLWGWGLWQQGRELILGG